MPGQNGGQIIKGDMVMRSSWNPHRIPDLNLWLRADNASVFIDAAKTTLCEADDTVAIWADSAGGSRSVNWEQTSAASRPIFEADAGTGGPGGNDFPAVRFRPVLGGGFFLECDSDITDGWTQGAIYVVCKMARDPPISAANAGFWHWGTGMFSSDHPGTLGSITEQWGTDLRMRVGNPTTPLNDWHVYKVSMSVDTFKVDINGVNIFSDAIDFTDTSWPDPLLIGRSKRGAAGPATHMDGHFAELLLFPTELDADDNTLVVDYLMTKYGIT